MALGWLKKIFSGYTRYIIAEIEVHRLQKVVRERDLEIQALQKMLREDVEIVSQYRQKVAVQLAKCGDSDCRSRRDPRCKGLNCSRHCNSYCSIRCKVAQYN
jgi:hypothetical protein